LNGENEIAYGFPSEELHNSLMPIICYFKCTAYIASQQSYIQIFQNGSYSRPVKSSAESNSFM